MSAKTQDAGRGEAIENVFRKIKEHDVRFVEMWFTDILGYHKSFSVTVAELQRAFDEGLGFDGSSVEGFVRIDESDMVALPDPNTFSVLPWMPLDSATAKMTCDIHWPGQQPFEGDPRYVLKRNLKRASDMGFTCYVGPELEYFYFRGNDNTGVLDNGGYFDVTPPNVASELRRETVLALESMGVGVEYTHHEVAPSQHEIDLRYTDALTMADNVMTYRLAVKQVAIKHGYYATFMPKPLAGVNGSGMHVHISLFKGERNAFFDKDDPYHLSKVGKCFLAGLLKHAAEITVVTSQWVNSYKRLVPGYEAPVNLVYSARNRSAAARIPMYTSQPKTKRIEFRSPDPSCNPYLAFPAMLMAGLDGIEKQIDPGQPLDKNTYELSPDEAAKLNTVPGSLEDSLRALEDDHEFLLKGGVFTPDVIDVWLEFKRETEIDAIRLRPHPYEFHLYFDV